VIAALHNIRSIHNVGSIFRTADALGIEKIHLCGITPLPVDSLGRPRQAFTKVSLGSESSVAWEARRSLSLLIKTLKAAGHTILALEQHKDSVPYYRVKLSPSEFARTVLVVGNEVKGLPVSALRQADTILEIPMVGKKESLNAAVAFGIAAFALRYHSS
jgi:tRNA G18 (ribose-2'-O)-methylase SpoU